MLPVKDRGSGASAAICGCHALTKTGRGAAYRNLLRPVFETLWDLCDDYNSKVGELLWWHGEHAIRGQMTAAAIKANMFAMDEYSCNRRSEAGKVVPKGRVDWWVATRYLEHELYVEMKQRELSNGARGGWRKVERSLDAGNGQLGGYALGNDVDDTCKVIVCFCRPYFFASKWQSDDTRAWLDKANQPENADFMAYYWLQNPVTWLQEWGYQGYRYVSPGLSIYCRSYLPDY